MPSSEPHVRNVEEFAADFLREAGGLPEMTRRDCEVASVDASAMLVTLSGGDDTVLENLRAAVERGDSWLLLEILKNLPHLDRVVLAELGWAIETDDTERSADCLRVLAGRGRRGKPLSNQQKGSEVANPVYNLMGRRAKTDLYLTRTLPKPAASAAELRDIENEKKVGFAALQLSSCADEWEGNLLFGNIWVLDGANAASNVNERILPPPTDW
mmetsp:Transcript_11336/g.31612  ORF Transcript_11336/g.31612 Transcript_11336/m.31612 type:complete len:214 (-) Transcript_11336:261-902(-)